MPLYARTPHEVFRTLKDHLNEVLNTVLTQYRLEFFARRKETRTALAFWDRHGQFTSIPLPPSPWYLFLGQQVEAIPEGRGYSLRTLRYGYRIQLTASPKDEALARFEYVSRSVDPAARYSPYHVQFHRDSQSPYDAFSLSKLHIPTGWVTIENVIRFLLTDLGVPPLTANWDEELRRSEAQFRAWTNRDVLEEKLKIL